MTTEQIAQVAHEVNKAYCTSIGDFSQPSWKDAPDWQKDSIINGVKFHMNDPDADPAKSHQSWLEQKEKEGWKYGEVKDTEKKERPCFLPYEKLPVAQQAKDFLFRQVVHSLLPFHTGPDSMLGHLRLARGLGIDENEGQGRSKTLSETLTLIDTAILWRQNDLNIKAAQDNAANQVSG